MTIETIYALAIALLLGFGYLVLRDPSVRHDSHNTPTCADETDADRARKGQEQASHRATERAIYDAMQNEPHGRTFDIDAWEAEQQKARARQRAAELSRPVFRWFEDPDMVDGEIVDCAPELPAPREVGISGREAKKFISAVQNRSR